MANNDLWISSGNPCLGCVDRLKLWLLVVLGGGKGKRRCQSRMKKNPVFCNGVSLFHVTSNI